jgi:two-component system KDP operon response regulator KdpE
MRILIDEVDKKAIDDVSLAINTFIPNCELIMIGSGKRCLDILRNNGYPNVIILGTNLADMSGFDLVKNIRSYSNVPIVILSYIQEGPLVKKAFELGISDYVTKPINSLEFTSKIKKLLYSDNS